MKFFLTAGLCMAMFAMLLPANELQAQDTFQFTINGDGDFDPPGGNPSADSTQLAYTSSTSGLSIVSWFLTSGNSLFGVESEQVESGPLLSKNGSDHSSTDNTFSYTAGLFGGDLFEGMTSIATLDWQFISNGDPIEGNFSQVLDGKTLVVTRSDGAVSSQTFANGTGSSASGSFSAVPEPSSAGILLLLGAGVGMHRRRRA